jgi:hypothetical protein
MFRDAYDGKVDTPLGKYTPKGRKLIDGTNPSSCVVILSTKDESELLSACGEDGELREKYNISSQNPMLEI